jgi:hypothetical protein
LRGGGACVCHGIVGGVDRGKVGKSVRSGGVCNVCIVSGVEGGVRISVDGPIGSTCACDISTCGSREEWLGRHDRVLCIVLALHVILGVLRRL